LEENEDCEKKEMGKENGEKSMEERAGEITDYKREKKEYKELYGVKKREENERWEEEAEETKTKEQV